MAQYVFLRQLDFEGEGDQPGIDRVTSEEVSPSWRGRFITLDGIDVTDQINSGELLPAVPSYNGAGSGIYQPGGWANLPNNKKALLDASGNILSIMEGPAPDSMSDLRGIVQTVRDTAPIWGPALGASLAGNPGMMPEDPWTYTLSNGAGEASSVAIETTAVNGGYADVAAAEDAWMGDLMRANPGAAAAATTAGGAAPWLTKANIGLATSVLGLGMTGYGFLEGRNAAKDTAQAARGTASTIETIANRTADETAAAIREQTSAIDRAAGAVQARADLEQRRADIQNNRTARDAIRAARIARARLVNSAANAGTVMSTAVRGGAGSVMSQLYSELGYFGQLQELNQASYLTQLVESDANVSASKASAKAQIAQGRGAAALAVAQGTGSAQQAVGNANVNRAAALGQLGGTIFAAGGGYKTIFGAL